MALLKNLMSSFSKLSLGSNTSSLQLLGQQCKCASNNVFAHYRLASGFMNPNYFAQNYQKREKLNVLPIYNLDLNNCKTISLTGLIQQQNIFTSPTYSNKNVLLEMHKWWNDARRKLRKKKKSPLDGKPFAKGVVLKTIVKKPRKPNSANRKCVLLRLSTGKEQVAYVPGEGHNLQEHNTVLVRVGRLRDVPGVKLKCVRGVYDLQKVIKRKAN